MSFFEDASLVLIPSAYKDQKVYSVKPTDGTGDLTFSRASSATRVQSNGLIEKVRTNLVLQSQTFDNASWLKYEATVTANATTAPDGTVSADLLLDNSNLDAHAVYQAISTGTGIYTWSVFAKAQNLNFLIISAYTGSHNRTWFNLSNGTVGTNAAGNTATITSVGNGWYRCSVSRSYTSGTFFSEVSPSNANGVFSYTGSTNGIFIWGAQLETGDIATDYIATTTAAVSVGPVSGLPRLDYLGSTCPRLILEPQRTNIAQYSEQFNNAYWTQDGTITANQATSPSGYLDADLVTITTSPSGVYRNGVIVSAGTYTASCFVKKNTANIVRLQIYDDIAGSSALASLNLTTLVLTLSGLTATGSVVDYGNGWYRVILTRTLAGSGWLFVQASGAVGESIYAWGAQVEEGAYATSYIPTLGASVTRVADSATKTGISSLIGQTEGTLFCEVQRLNTGAGSGVVPIQLNDGTNNNRAQIEISSAGAALCIVSSGGSVVANITGPTLTLGQTYKIAISYKLNDFKIFVNGVLGGSDTSGAVPVSMSRLDLASEAGIGYAGFALAQALHFKTALTSTQLAELTA